MLQKLAAS